MRSILRSEHISSNEKFQFSGKVREEWSIDGDIAESESRLWTSEMSKVYYPTVYDFTMLSFRELEISFLSVFFSSQIGD